MPPVARCLGFTPAITRLHPVVIDRCQWVAFPSFLRPLRPSAPPRPISSFPSAPFPFCSTSPRIIYGFPCSIVVDPQLYPVAILRACATACVADLRYSRVSTRYWVPEKASFEHSSSDTIRLHASYLLPSWVVSLPRFGAKIALRYILVSRPRTTRLLTCGFPSYSLCTQPNSEGLLDWNIPKANRQTRDSLIENRETRT